MIDDFVKKVQETGEISIISQEIFVQDPLTRIQNLKVRIISVSKIEEMKLYIDTIVSYKHQVDMCASGAHIW